MILTIVAVLISSEYIVSSTSPDFTNIQSLYYVSYFRNDGSYEECEKKCKDMSSDLLNIETVHELADISDMLDAQVETCLGPIRIGGKYDKKTERWMSSRGYPLDESGSGADMFIWCKGYPVPVNFDEFYRERIEMCLAVTCKWDKKWCVINIDCSVIRPFMCEQNSEPGKPIAVSVHSNNTARVSDEFPTRLPFTTAYPTHHSQWQPFRNRQYVHYSRIDKTPQNSYMGGLLEDIEASFNWIKKLG